MLWKLCMQYASKFGKLSSGHRTGKGQFSFQYQRKAMQKNVQTIAQLHSSHTETATHSSVLVWRIPGMVEPGGLSSMGSHRVGHDWSDLAAAAAHSTKVMLKILQARLQQYMNRELPDVQAGFRKGGTQRLNCRHPLDHQKGKRVPEQHLLLFFDYAKAFDCVITTNCGKFFKRWEYQTTWSACWEIYMQVKKQQLELDMKQQTGSK